MPSDGAGPHGPPEPRAGAEPPPSALSRLARLTGYDLSIHELLDAVWLAARLPADSGTPLARSLPGAFDRLPRSGTGHETGTSEDPSAAGPTRGSSQAPSPAPQPPPPATLLGALHAAAAARSAPEFAELGTDHRAAAHEGAMPVLVPEEKALGEDELRFGRALRSLKQPRPDPFKTEFDEEATAVALVETGLPDMVTRPARQRWLNLVLLIDDGISMLLWQRLATELRALSVRLGAFRDIRVHGLDTRAARAPLLRARPFAPHTPVLSPASVIDPSGRTLVLVISDGVGACWRDGRMAKALERWARQGPTAIMHTLPAHLWDGSGIRSEPWLVTSRRRGAANHAWEVTDPLLPPGLGEDFTGVPVPVLEPYPPAVAAWARLVASPGASAQLPLLKPSPTRGRAARPALAAGTRRALCCGSGTPRHRRRTGWPPTSPRCHRSPCL